MIGSLTQLEGWASAVAGVIGLIAVFAPFITLIKGLKKLQFGYPGVFIFLAEIGTLTAFLTVIVYRQGLHRIPPYWLWIVSSVVAVVALLWLAESVSNNRNVKALQISFGALLHTTAAVCFVLGITLLSAENLIFKQLKGTVIVLQGQEKKGVPVYLQLTDSQVLETRTDRRGNYRFLLIGQERNQAGQIRVRRNKEGKNHVVVSEACAGHEWSVCTVDAIRLQ